LKTQKICGIIIAYIKDIKKQFGRSRTENRPDGIKGRKGLGDREKKSTKLHAN
jgi:hypothetical protein